MTLTRREQENERINLHAVARCERGADKVGGRYPARTTLESARFFDKAIFTYHSGGKYLVGQSLDPGLVSRMVTRAETASKHDRSVSTFIQYETETRTDSVRQGPLLIS